MEENFRYEYYYREMYFETLHNFSVLLDPFADNYNPDYLSHHH